MPVRKVSVMGRRGDSTTYGVSLDRGDLEVMGVLDELEEGGEVRASINRQGPDRFEVVILGVDEEEQLVAPSAD